MQTFGCAKYFLSAASPWQSLRLKLFAKKNSLHKFKDVILFECAPGSNQSKVDINFALNVSNRITELHPDLCVIISSPIEIDGSNTRIIDGSVLSFKENAELTRYCSLLIGCSSGLSWLSTSDWAKQLPMIQLLNRKFYLFAGMSYDFKFWGLSNDHILEMLEFSEEKIINCLETIWQKNFKMARDQFHEVYIPSYSNFQNIVWILFSQRKVLSAHPLLQSLPIP